MTRFSITFDKGLIDFTCQFIPDGCTIRVPEERANPTILPKDEEITIYTMLFEQARLKLPLDPLLCDVLTAINMSLCQMSRNGVRIVPGFFSLNKMMG